MDFMCGEVVSKTFLLVLVISMRTIIVESTINVKNTHRRQLRSFVFPPTAPTRVQVRVTSLH